MPIEKLLVQCFYHFSIEINQEENSKVQKPRKSIFIEPGSSWKNGYNESFNGKLRDECLNGEIFYSLKEAQIIIEQWRIHYNTQRPHSALGYRPPAPVTRAIKPTLTNQMTIMQ